MWSYRCIYVGDLGGIVLLSVGVVDLLLCVVWSGGGSCGPVKPGTVGI